LLAESTGKEGRGIVPIAGEALGNPDVYDNDRVFVQFRLKDRGTQTMDQGVEALRHAGHPVIVIDLNDKMDVAQEFFRWEVATAVAGSVLEINAFNQPNVQESKDNTNDLLKEVEDKGELPKDTPAMTKEPLELYADEAAGDVAESLREFFVQKVFGDYVAIMAYFTETSATETLLQTIRHRLRDRLRVATTLGYGPRFLHSTGQLHKGGPNTGIFLQLTADDPNDAEIPDRPYTFGTFKRAQAMGDLRALRRHGRRVVRVHLGADVGEGLAKLDDLMLSWTGLPVHASTA
jgi:hypothetical protein